MEQEEKKSSEEVMQTILDRVRADKSKSLTVNRLPLETKAAFEEFAKKEFDDDWGFAFKAVFDEAMEYRKVKGLFFAALGRMDAIESKLMQIENQVLHMTQPKAEEKKGVKLMGGKIIGGN